LTVIFLLGSIKNEESISKSTEKMLRCKSVLQALIVTSADNPGSVRLRVCIYRPLLASQQLIAVLYRYSQRLCTPRQIYKCAAYLLNRTPTNAPGWKTPSEMVYGKKPSLDPLKLYVGRFLLRIYLRVVACVETDRIDSSILCCICRVSLRRAVTSM
jgi:hypothetical protein